LRHGGVKRPSLFRAPSPPNGGPIRLLAVTGSHRLLAGGRSQVDFNAPLDSSHPDYLTYRRADNGRLKKDAGDKLILRFMQGTDDEALSARQAAGIASDAQFRLLTDDAPFLKRIWNDTKKFDADELKALGQYASLYEGTNHFLAARLDAGDITDKEYKSVRDSFSNSGRNLSNGIGDGAGRTIFNLNAQWIGNFELENIKPGLISKITDFIGGTEGAVNPDIAIKGGVLSGALA